MHGKAASAPWSPSRARWRARRPISRAPLPGGANIPTRYCAKPATAQTTYAACAMQAPSEHHREHRPMPTDTAPPGRLDIESDAGLLRIRIVNPARYNAMSLAMWEALGAAVRSDEHTSELQSLMR